METHFLTGTNQCHPKTRDPRARTLSTQRHAPTRRAHNTAHMHKGAHLTFFAPHTPFSAAQRPLEHRIRTHAQAPAQRPPLGPERRAASSLSNAHKYAPFDAHRPHARTPLPATATSRPARQQLLQHHEEDACSPEPTQPSPQHAGEHVSGQHRGAKAARCMTKGQDWKVKEGDWGGGGAERFAHHGRIDEDGTCSACS